MKIYIETSVINFLFATDEPEKMKKTQEFFENIAQKHEICISDVVLVEIERARSPKKDMLKAMILSLNPRILFSSYACEDLAKKYLEEKIIPERYFNDALHIAIATINGIDALASWNMEHITNLTTILAVKKVNKNMGYQDIVICTPEEVSE